VLYGEANDGNGFEHYQRAVAAMAATGLQSPDIAQVMQQESCALAGVVFTGRVPGLTGLALLEATAAAMASLQAGAHSSVATRRIQWERGLGQSIPNLLTTRDLVNTALVHAMRAVAAGAYARAVEVWLDALQYARDTMGEPTLVGEMVGVALMHIGAREAPAVPALLQRLDRAALAELSHGLAVLDSALPQSSRSFETEPLLLVRHFDTLGWSAFEVPLWSAWRYGFSPRLAIVAHVHAALAVVDARQATIGQGRVDFATADRLYDAFRDGRNPVTQRCTVRSILRDRLGAVASLRVLRMAVQHRLGEPVTPLPDPFGGDLQFVLGADGAASFWSDADKRSTRLELTVAGKGR
jgi:hypothetical protein